MQTSVTAVAFLHTSIRNGEFLLAIGLETGGIELWSIPTFEASSTKGPKLLHQIPTLDCHSASVRRLAWRPQLNGIIANKESPRNFFLASCGLDNGVKIFEVSLDYQS